LFSGVCVTISSEEKDKIRRKKYWPPPPKQLNWKFVYLKFDLTFICVGCGLHGEGLKGNPGCKRITARVGLAVFITDVDLANGHLQVLDDVRALLKRYLNYFGNRRSGSLSGNQRRWPFLNRSFFRKFLVIGLYGARAVNWEKTNTSSVKTESQNNNGQYLIANHLIVLDENKIKDRTNLSRKVSPDPGSSAGSSPFESCPILLASSAIWKWSFNLETLNL